MKTKAASLGHLHRTLKRKNNKAKNNLSSSFKPQFSLPSLHERKQTDHSFRQLPENQVKKDSLFHDVINNLPGIIFQLQRNANDEYVFNFISPAISQLLGMAITNTRQIWSFIHPEDRGPWLQSVEKAYSQTTPWKQELRFLMPDNTVYWWLGTATPSYAATGELLYNGILLNITRQKQAELTLRENERKWRRAMEGSGDGFWEYNAITNQTHYSSFFKQILGFEEKDYINNPSFWRTNVHPDDLPALDALEADYQSGAFESHSIQYRTRNKQGEYIWIMDRGIVFSKDADGKPVHFIGVHTNIDTIKKNELELKATATKLKTLITSIQDGILLEDENHNIILCNQAACDIFGIPFSPQQLCGKNIEQVLRKQSQRAAEFHKIMIRRHELLNDCQIAANEEIELFNGKWLLRDYAPLTIEGTCKGHLWKYTDITQRKKARIRLIEAERRYRCLIENMQVGLVELDMADNIIYANQTFYDMCGYNKVELNGQLAELICKESIQIVKQKKALRIKGISDAYEIEIVTKSGEKRWWYVSGAPRQNDQLLTIATIGAFLDITEQKRTEQELRQAKQVAERTADEKDTFLANMSHELRTPLNAVFGMSRLMEKTPLLPQQRFYLETILNSTSSLMHVVNDILDFSKISVGKLSLERIGFKVKDIIAASVDLVAYRAQEKGLQLIVNNTQCCNSVLLGDPFRLKQVFTNLLTNAVKFTNKGGVTINWSNQGLHNGKRHIAVQVKDTGRGMDEAFLKILFDKFTQEDESIARSYSGTGLGMSISKHLVELMGSTIQVESAKNIGTTFNLHLFFEEGTEADLLADEVELADVKMLEGKQILLVEDNEMNQLVAKTLLEQNGLQVLVASNGIEAIDCVKNNLIDLVLMDMQMPIMDGLKATTIIRETHKTLPIIALTANALKGEQDKCHAVGMNDFLTKPFEEKVLLNILCKWLCKTPDANAIIATITEPVTDKAPELQDVFSNERLYNLEKIQAISPGNTAFLKTLLEVFINDAGGTVLKLKDAYQQRDYKAIKALAHRIKPSIDQLVIPYASEIKQIEALSLAEDTTEELGRLVAGFETLMTQVTSSLKTELL